MGTLDRGSVPASGSARVVRALICVALVAATALACMSSTPASPSAVAIAATRTPSPSPTTAPTADAPPALIHRHISGAGYGISFDYPADWHDVMPPHFLASFTNGDDAALVPKCCHLNPNQLGVSIATGSAAPVDIGAIRSPGWEVKNVGDWLVGRESMPATPSNFVDVQTYWMIGRPGPGETLYSIGAIFRGPDLAPMQAQVDAFVDSIKLDPEPTASPS
jgi:hypothetical protein